MTKQSDKVSAEDVRHVADLANLELTAYEETAMIRDLNAILGHLDQLNELDVADVKPMAQVSEVLEADMPPGSDAAAVSALRPDRIDACLPRSSVLSNAPDTDGIFFKVPRVMER